MMKNKHVVLMIFKIMKFQKVHVQSHTKIMLNNDFLKS